jgi:hypothetical protein
VLFGLTLVPVNGSAATVTADAHSEVSAAYPWGSTTPTWDQFNNQNTVSAADAALGQLETPTFTGSGRPVRGRSRRPDGYQRPELLPGQHRGPGGE